MTNHSEHVFQNELRAEVGDSARAYQQASGTQFNIDIANAFLQQEPGNLFPFNAVEVAPLVREADPLELGVHRAAINKGTPITPYVARDIDKPLAIQWRTAVSAGGFILLVGDSTSGKTRAAYETVLAESPNHRLFSPETGQELQSGVLSILALKEPYLIWLDDIERFLNEDRLTITMLRLLRQRKVPVLGTLKSSLFSYLTATSSNPGQPDKEHSHGLNMSERVLEQASVIVVQRKWSAEELARAAEIPDARLDEAITHSGLYGVAEYLTAGPNLYREWNLAWQAGGAPRGAALVAAAVDLNRIGLTGALPIELIEEAHVTYLEAAGGEMLRPEPVKEALAWALRRRAGVTSLLLPGQVGDTYRAFDYLPDTLDRAAVQPVPIEIWTVAEKFCHEHQSSLLPLARGAHRLEEYEVEERCLIAMIEAGQVALSSELAQLYRQQNRFSEMADTLNLALTNGDIESGVQLGILFEQQGRLDAAEQALRVAAQNGDRHATFHLASLLQQTGQLKEAEELINRSSPDLNSSDYYILSSVLNEMGRSGEAERWLRKSVDEGNSEAQIALGTLLSEMGRFEEAEALWQDPESKSDPNAIINLGLMYERSGRIADAEKIYRQRLDDDPVQFHTRLANLLIETSRFSEAEEILESIPLHEDSEAAMLLGQIRIKNGRIEDALDAFRIAAAGGQARAYAMIAHFLEESSGADEAVEWWRRAAEAGDDAAGFKLGVLANDAGNLEEAEKWFRIAASQGRSVGSCELAMLLQASGRPAEAEVHFTNSFRRGHTHAGCQLGSLLMRLNRPGEAVIVWEETAQQGHGHAAELLSQFFVAIGQGKKAALWLKLSREGVHQQPSIGGQVKKKRRKPRNKSRRKRKL